MAPLGNLLRLAPLQTQQLPSHPSIVVSSGDQSGRKQTENGSDEATKSSRPNLVTFVEEILDEALTFVDGTLPSTFGQFSERISPPGQIEVQLLKREISGHELSQVPWTKSKVPRHVPEGVQNTSELWFARKSSHINHVGQDTADFREFDNGLRINHPEHEREYTPDVYDSYKILEWDVDKSWAEEGVNRGLYSDVTMTIYEMCHKLPFPLSPRVFPVLVITAKTGRDGFVVVQLPVNVESLHGAFYSNRRNEREGSNALKRKKPVLGVYTSIERCILRADHDIEWTMATTSDAKGWLPLWIQKLGIPGAIFKDVKFLLEWILKKRGGRQ
ncbi:MAG: hypothetical protein Q9167_002554 [Letrouitia subvulpina]